MTLRPRATILIVCFDNLGDVVFASTLAASLSKHDPHINIDVWTKEYCAKVASSYPNVRQVYASNPYWDKTPGIGRGSFFKFVRTWWTINASHTYDAILVASPNWRGAMWSRFLRASVRIGFASKKSRWWLNSQVPWDPAEGICKTLSLLLQPLNVKGCGYYSLTRPHDTKSERNLVYVHGFAGDRRRCLKSSDLRLVLQHLCTVCPSQWSIRLLGTPNELASVADLMLQCPAVMTATPQELATQIDRAVFFVGHDSGPLHIANAKGVPVFGIYLPGTPPRTLPNGTAKHRVYHRPSPDHIVAEELTQALSDFVNEVATDNLKPEVSS